MTSPLPPSQSHLNPSTMEEEEQCNTSLSLSFLGRVEEFEEKHGLEDRNPVQFHVLFPTGLEDEKEDESSRERSHGEEEDMIIRDSNGSVARKKLRLSEEQLALLKDSFEEHSILNANQKQEMASRLNLQVRQVEVWFQNRRARTKLKKTEMECELLRRYCQSLSDENRRLKKELQELGMVKSASPFHIHLQKQRKHAMCPSCHHGEADREDKSPRSLDSISEKSRIYSC